MLEALLTFRGEGPTDQSAKSAQFSPLWKSLPNPSCVPRSPSSTTLQDGLRRAGLLPDSPRFVPLIIGDHFPCSLGVVPVPQHDAVAADLKLPSSVQRHGLPRFWILNFCLQRRRSRALGVLSQTLQQAPQLQHWVCCRRRTWSKRGGSCSPLCGGRCIPPSWFFCQCCRWGIP